MDQTNNNIHDSQNDFVNDNINETKNINGSERELVNEDMAQVVPDTNPLLSETSAGIDDDQSSVEDSCVPVLAPLRKDAVDDKDPDKKRLTGNNTQVTTTLPMTIVMTMRILPVIRLNQLLCLMKGMAISLGT